MNTIKRLYRSRRERMVGGVCGGLGQYVGIDPTLIRLAFALATLLQGAGILAYLVLWAITPCEAKEAAPTTEPPPPPEA